jgi:hypothetical protein
MCQLTVCTKNHQNSQFTFNNPYNKLDRMIFGMPAPQAKARSKGRGLLDFSAWRHPRNIHTHDAARSSPQVTDHLCDIIQSIRSLPDGGNPQAVIPAEGEATEPGSQEGEERFRDPGSAFGRPG